MPTVLSKEAREGMRVAIVLVSLLAMTPLPAAGAAPDAVRLDFKMKSESFEGTRLASSKVGNEVVFISDHLVISENDQRSVIINSKQERITFIHHGDKIFETTNLPFRLEDHVFGDQEDVLKKMSAIATSAVEIRQESETVNHGIWKARRVYVKSTAPAAGFQIEMDLLLSSDPPIDYHLYDTLPKNLYAMSVFTREWGDQVVALEGIAVHQKMTTRMGKMSRIVWSDLLSVERITIPEEKLVPPRSYREVPFDLSRYFGTAR